MSAMVMCLACGEFRPAFEKAESVRPVAETCRMCGETDYRCPSRE